MQKLNTLLYIIGIGILLTALSCNDNPQEKKAILPASSGGQNEIIIVMKDRLWETMPGLKLQDCFAKPYPALPQGEPLYDMVQIDPTEFKKLAQNHFNILIADIDKKHNTPRIIIDKDIWAKPQLIVKVFAADTNTFNNFFEVNQEKILAYFDKEEQDRLLKRYNSHKNKKAITILEKDHDITLNIPEGFGLDISKKAENFAWLSFETNKTSQGIFIYYYPYTDSTQFTKKQLIKVRDSILKANVPGQLKNSYMTTEHDLPVEAIRTEIQSHSAIQMRGLWETVGDFMGGPFISYTIYDPKHNRIITCEGYVYAPNLDKRNLIKQLDAILYTCKTK